MMIKTPRVRMFRQVMGSAIGLETRKELECREGEGEAKGEGDDDMNATSAAG